MSGTRVAIGPPAHSDRLPLGRKLGHHPLRSCERTSEAGLLGPHWEGKAFQVSPGSSFALKDFDSREFSSLTSRQSFNLNSEIEPQIPPISQILREFIGDERTNLFVAKLQGIYNGKAFIMVTCHIRVICVIRG